MKKHTNRLFALVLILTLILTVLAPIYANAENSADNSELELPQGQSFIKIEDGNSVRFYGVTGYDYTKDSETQTDEITISSVEEYKALTQENINNKKEVASLGTASLPSYVDNSQSKFFPAIGNQGSLGSCLFWAQIYYQFTYMMNKDLSIETTEDNTYSPQWAYNILAGTTHTIDTYYNLYRFMENQGNVFLNQVPYDLNVTSFSPTEEIWKTSINNRIESYYEIEDVGEEDSQITSADDEDLNIIKTALTNGEVLAYSTCINSWVTTQLKTNSSALENSKFSNEYAISSQIGTDGGHRMTIVGYNDNLWIDINDNNCVDSGEMGAFKVANSWGDGYGNNGFIWVAYDALNEVSCVEGVEHNSKREAIFNEISGIKVLKQGTKADLYLKYTLNTADRTQSKVSVTAEKDGSIYTRRAYSDESLGEKIAYDGSDVATDATMILLLSSVNENITSETLNDYTISVQVEDTEADSVPVVVKDLQIIDEAANKVYTSTTQLPITLDGEVTSVPFTESSLNHAVIYYIGYKAPMLNYKLENGSFASTTGIPLEENLERRGYTHKYVIDLESKDLAYLYFTDGNGNIDNNNGNYYTAKKGNNYYVTENSAEPMSVSMTTDFTGIADINRGCNFNAEASGGYEPYLYQFTFTNTDTGNVTVEEFDEFMSEYFFFREAGKYIVTVEVMDYSDTVVSKQMEVTVENLPFEFEKLTTDEGALLVGEKMTFNAITKNEQIIYRGYSNNDYTFTVKDESGTVCFTNTTKSTKFNLNIRFSEILQTFVPHKSGNYTVTVSSTDNNKEYAEMTIDFTVFDKIIGDANGSGDVNIMDATLIQQFLANIITAEEIYSEMSDCDTNLDINIMDATAIQCYLAHRDGSGSTGEVIEYIPPTEPETEPTEAETEKPTEAPQTNTVTFTNSLNWSGTMYCYYWSDDNTAMTSWPGKAMSNAGTNDFSQTLYTFEVPSDASYIIFTNGSLQTVDIKYTGGEVKYYALSTKTGNGYNVETW